MKPISFREQTGVFAEDQPEYGDLPSHLDGGPEGIVTSCWGLSWSERVRILLSGKLWLQVMTFYQPLQPLNVAAEKPILAGGEELD